MKWFFFAIVVIYVLKSVLTGLSSFHSGRRRFRYRTRNK